jgi:hypothetical protein
VISAIVKLKEIITTKVHKIFSIITIIVSSILMLIQIIGIIRSRDASSWLEKSWRNNIKGGTKGKFLKIFPKYRRATNYIKNYVPIL